MTLSNIGSTFSSKEIAQGTLRVTLAKDYLAAYVAAPFLGADAPAAFAHNETADERGIEIGPALARAFRAELLAQR